MTHPVAVPRLCCELDSSSFGVLTALPPRSWLLMSTIGSAAGKSLVDGTL